MMFLHNTSQETSFFLGIIGTIATATVAYWMLNDNSNHTSHDFMTDEEGNEYISLSSIKKSPNIVVNEKGEQYIKISQID